MKKQPKFNVNQASWLQAKSMPGGEDLSIFKDWLLDPHSMTLKMKRITNSFRIELLAQKMEYSKNVAFFVREIIIWCDEKPWLYARTTVPMKNFKGMIQQLRFLGEKPLGKFLFSVKSLTRSPFNIEVLPLHDPRIEKIVKRLSLPSKKQLLMRESTLKIHKTPINLMEIFLPSMWNMQND